MRRNTALPLVLVVGVFGLLYFSTNDASAGAAPEPGLFSDDKLGGGRLLSDVLLRPEPIVITVAKLGESCDIATVTDVEIADFTGDGRNDIAVAWYATDYELPAQAQRRLAIYQPAGTGFELVASINLYVYDPSAPAYSIFRCGTSDIGYGDLDGDGDLDLLATPYFGDELWFIENLGNGQFAQHLKFPFGTSSPTNFLTPPEVQMADLDGDGRDEAIYLVDPILYIDGQIVHIWSTKTTIEQIERVYWEPGPGALETQWTRGLAIADFDGDTHPDLCFTGSIHPPYEDDPVLTIWHGFDTATERFCVYNKFPPMLCSDVVAVRTSLHHPAGVLLTDLDGTRVQYWANRAGASGQPKLQLAAEITGYAAHAPNRGMAAVAADLDGDGDLDLVTRQKMGALDDPDQIELTLCRQGAVRWTRFAPTPIDTSGFADSAASEILRPHNLAVGDLLGNTLPEIVAGFQANVVLPTNGQRDGERTEVQIAIWQNSCLGDVTHDGLADFEDLAALLLALNSCLGDVRYNADADLNKDGCVDSADESLLQTDLGCRLCGNRSGDLNCDCALDLNDIEPFTLAIMDARAYRAAFPLCERMNADCNGDGVVDYRDIDPFVGLLGGSPTLEPASTRPDSACGRRVH